MMSVFFHGDWNAQTPPIILLLGRVPTTISYLAFSYKQLCIMWCNGNSADQHISAVVEQNHCIPLLYISLPGQLVVK